MFNSLEMYVLYGDTAQHTVLAEGGKDNKVTRTDMIGRVRLIRMDRG